MTEPPNKNDRELHDFWQHLQENQPTAPNHLAARITARAEEPPDIYARLANWFLAPLWRSAVAFLLPLAFGFSVGFTEPLETDETQQSYEVETLLFADTLDPFSAEETDEI